MVGRIGRVAIGGRKRKENGKQSQPVDCLLTLDFLSSFWRFGPHRVGTQNPTTAAWLPTCPSACAESQAGEFISSQDPRVEGRARGERLN